MVPNHSRELSVRLRIKSSGVLDGANQLDGFEWVGVIELLERVDEFRGMW